MTRIKLFATLAAAIVLAIPAAAVIAQGQQPAATAPVHPFEYAVKFVCGRSVATRFRPQTASGNYYTMINVHNPGRRFEWSHKVALAGIDAPGRVTGFQTGMPLRYDEAVDFDCPWIERQLAADGIPAPGLFTGFVVLQASQELDVVAVYTAAPTNTNQVSTMHTERVPVRRVGR